MRPLGVDTMLKFTDGPGLSLRAERVLGPKMGLDWAYCGGLWIGLIRFMNSSFLILFTNVGFSFL